MSFKTFSLKKTVSLTELPDDMVVHIIKMNPSVAKHLMSTCRNLYDIVKNHPYLFNEYSLNEIPRSLCFNQIEKGFGLQTLPIFFKALEKYLMKEPKHSPIIRISEKLDSGSMLELLNFLNTLYKSQDMLRVVLDFLEKIHPTSFNILIRTLKSNHPENENIAGNIPPFNQMNDDVLHCLARKKHSILFALPKHVQERFSIHPLFLNMRMMKFSSRNIQKESAILDPRKRIRYCSPEVQKDLVQTNMQYAFYCSPKVQKEFLETNPQYTFYYSRYSP